MKLKKHRNENGIISSKENIINDDEYEKLMKINVYNNNKDIFFEFERNKYELDETHNIISPNTSWFLLKPSKMDPKMNRYKISPGEILKIGRITLRIRDIKFNKKANNNNDNSNFNNTSLNDSNTSNDNLKEMQIMKTEGVPNDANLKDNKNKNNKKKDIKLDIEPSEKIINIIKKKETKKNNIFTKVEKKVMYAEYAI